MPEIVGENSVPQGRAGTGAAYILGANVPSALSIIINGQRSRDLAAQRMAALKLKQEQEAAKELDNSLKYGTKGGALYQNALNSRVFNGLSDKLVAVERERMAGKIDMYTAKQQQATLKRNAEDEQTLSLAKQTEYQDGYKAVQADSKGRDATAYNVGYQGSLTRKGADGQQEALLPSEHDNLAAMQAQDNNPMTYVTDEQLRRHVQGAQQNTLADAHAGLIGGTHGANTLTYKGIVVDRQKDGSFAPRMEGGRPVVDVNQADMERDRGGNHGLDMGIKRMEMNDATLAAAEGRAPKDALTLYKEGLSKYVNFRQTETEARNAQPHQPRAAGGKPKGYDIQANDGSFSDYTLPATIRDGKDYSMAKPLYPGGLSVGGKPTFQNGQETFGGGKKPMRVDGKEVVTTGTRFATIYRRNEAGVLVREDNNTKPIAGTYQEHFTDAIDANGHLITGRTKAEKAQMVHDGKATTGTFVVMSSIGNKDYTAAYTESLKSLKEVNDQAFGDRKKPDAVLEDEAKRMALHGSEAVVVPYDKQQHLLIDADTKGFYQRGHQRTLQIRKELQQGSQQPAQTPKEKVVRPTFLKSKSAPAAKPAANPTKQAVDNSGGML